MIVQRLHYELNVTTRPSLPGRTAVDFYQHWPQALHPHWRHICQLQLTRDELLKLSEVLRDASRAE